MQNALFIGQPYIAHQGGYVRLCADIERPSGPFTLYFELSPEYESYLCTERTNAFVLGILEYAMYMGYDIKSDTPMDEELYYSLTHYGANILSQNISYFHSIKLNIPFDAEPIKSEGAVGTGFSAGVDSFYTVLKHLHPEEPSYQLTHLLIANVGAFTYAETAKTEKLFYQQMQALLPATQELQLPLISINTNFGDLYLELDVPVEYISYVYAGTVLKIGSCVYALQKLFSKYYIASSLGYEKFEFNEQDPNFAQLYYMTLFTTTSLSFYSSGSEAKRIEKLEAICQNETVRRYLSVDLGKNCSHCIKCTRTMFELYALGVLDEYKGLFDVEGFKNRIVYRGGVYLSNQAERHDGFTTEILDMCKRNNVRIPTMAHILAFFVFRPWYAVKTFARKSQLVRTIYYKLNLDLLGKDAAGKENAMAWRESFTAKKKQE